MLYIIENDESSVELKEGINDIEVAKIIIKEVDTVSEEYPEINGIEENSIDREDISMCMTNEEAMTEIITVNSKEDDDTVVDKVIEDNDNIREVLGDSKSFHGN